MKRKSNTEIVNKPVENTVINTANQEEINNSMDKTIFFSVSEAKKRTNAVHKKRLEVEMLPVYNVINNAINAGKYQIDLIELTDSQRMFLADKNFGVAYKKKVNDKNYYMIYWD